MKILPLDVATEVGWAMLDTQTPPSGWPIGHFRCIGKEPWEKSQSLRSGIRDVIKIHGKPDVAIIEMPLQIAPQYKRKPKEDMIGGNIQDRQHLASVMADRLVTAIKRGGLEGDETQDLVKEIWGSESTMNSKTIAQLNWLGGAAQAVCEGMGIPFQFVGPRTWQTIIPKEIRGGTKERVRQYCDQLRILGGDNNARDAAIIGVWAWKKSQLVKQIENSMQGALV